MGIKQVEVHLVQVYCLVVKRSCLRYHTSFKVLTARVILPGGQLWKYVWEHYVRQNFRCRSRHIEAARNSRKRFRAPGRKKKKLTRTSVQIKSVPRWTKHKYKSNPGARDFGKSAHRLWRHKYSCRATRLSAGNSATCFIACSGTDIRRLAYTYIYTLMMMIIIDR